MDKYLTVEDVANMLQVHQDTIREYVRSGKIKSFRLGGKYIRIKAPDVTAFVSASEYSSSNTVQSFPLKSETE